MKRFLLLMLVVMALLLPRTAAAKVSLTYELNFDQQYYLHTWNELAVTVKNTEGPDWQGTVEVEQGSRYIKEIFVAEGSAVTVPFYLPPRDLLQPFFQDHDNILKIQLKDNKQRAVSKPTTVRFNEGGEINLLLGVLAANPDKFNRLAHLTPGSLPADSKVIPLKNRHFNHQLFMDNFALIIVNDGETLRLTPEQQENLEQWVSNGGLLVIGGGRGWQKNLAALPDSLLPYTPTGTVETESLSLLTDQVKLVNGKGNRFLLTTGQADPAKGQTLLEAAEGPLLISGNHGRGQVIYSTLNLEDPPFDNTLNFEAFWGYLVNLNSERLAQITERRAHWELAELLSYLARSNTDQAFLSPGRLFTGLLFYILLVGPISYLILKRRQKWEWSWFIIPALALLFSGAIYAAGSSGRQTELTHYQVNVLDLIPGNRAAALESYGGLFIPRRGNLSLNATGPALAAGKGATLTAGTPGETAIELTNPPLWSIQRLYARNTIALDGPIDLSVSAGGPKVEITVANNSGLDLFKSYARLGDEWFNTGPLAAGQEKTIPLDQGGHLDLFPILEHYQKHHGGPRHYPGYGLDGFPSNGLLWLGFNDDQQPFQLEGEVKTVPLNILSLNCGLAQFKLASTFDLPPGWLIPQLVGFGGDSQYLNVDHYWPGNPGYERHFSGQGWVDLQFNFPPGIDYEKGTYQLDLSHIGGEGQLAIEVFNHQQQEWQEVADFRPGSSYQQGKFILTDLDRLIAEDRLRIRVSYNGELWLMINQILSVQGGQLK